jgi:DNA polymerase-4
VAQNKLVAKIASDLDKPDGLTIVPEGRTNEVLDPLSVRRLPGLGRKSGARVEAAGIRTFGELRNAPDAVLRPLFGRYTQRVRERAAGLDDRPVIPDRDEKSISAEETFERDISDPRLLQAELTQLAGRACERLRHRQLTAGCIGVKIRRADFVTFTRQRAVAPPTHDGRTVANVARELLTRWLKSAPGAKLRLLGVVLSDLSPASQLGLFEDTPPHTSRLDAALDEVRARFGNGALQRGNTIK